MAVTVRLRPVPSGGRVTDVRLFDPAGAGSAVSVVLGHMRQQGAS